MRLHAHVVFHFEGAVNLLAKFIENLAGRAGHIHILQGTGTRKIHRKLALHAAWPERQQGHAIAEAYGLADVVRNKDNGASRLSPDAFEFIVQEVASL